MVLLHMSWAAWRALLERLAQKRQLLANIRSRWGQQGVGKAWRSSAYFDLVRGSVADVYVDDKTWLELEFPKIFARFDTTTTPLGRQYLFFMMRIYVEDRQVLAERYHYAQALRSDSGLRERIQLALAALKDDGYADVVDLIFSETPSAVKYPQLLLLWSAVGLLTLLGAIGSIVPA